MNQKEQTNRYRAIHLLVLAAMLCTVIGCSNIGGLREFNGVVVGKRDSNQILVVSNVDVDTVRDKTDAELLAIARQQNGVYFSVDKVTFETVTIGTRVVVFYDPDDGEEVSVPPRRYSKRVEILSD